MQTPVFYPGLSTRARREVRTRYAMDQGGLCWNCKRPLSEPPPASIVNLPLDLTRFPPGFLLHPVHLHHDHKTGMTIGAVHAHCNGYLFQYHGE